MRQGLRWAMRLIGPLLLLVFLWRTDLTLVGASLRQLDWTPLAWSLALFPLFVIVKSWRWVLIMRELGIAPPSLAETATLYTIGLYVGGITPGQSGDFIKAWYLRDRGQPLAAALFSIVVDRLFDFVVMAVLAIAGLAAFAAVFPPAMQAPLAGGTLVFAALVFALTPVLAARGARERMFAIVLPLVPERMRPAVAGWRDQLRGLSLRPALLGWLMLASLASAGSTVLRIWLLFAALSLGAVPPLAIIGATALISILQALPISFAGVGVRDAILIAVLGYYGYPAELAISLSALFLLLNIEHILLGFLVSLRHPIGRPPADAVAPPSPGGSA
jgi:uncharacterized protein (TIRG00374 family)